MKASDTNLFTTLLLLLLFTTAAAVTDDDTPKLISFKNSLKNPNTALPTWLPTTSPCNYHGVSCNQNDSRVSSIDLSNVPLNVDFSKVSTFLLSIQSLRSFSANNANISGRIVIVQSCSSSLGSLDLTQNSISGPLNVLVELLKGCSGLTFLNLSTNSLDPLVGRVPVGVKVPSLHVLDLSHNNVSGSWLLSDSLFPQLEYLSLRGNKIGGFFPELIGFKNLMYLDVSANNITSKFPTFGDCSSLQHLDLSSNKFFGDTGSSLSKCGKLSFVNLTSNRLTGSVPSGRSIRFLYLQENEFQGFLQESVVSDLCDTIVELDLSFNNLTELSVSLIYVKLQIIPLKTEAAT